MGEKLQIEINDKFYELGPSESISHHISIKDNNQPDAFFLPKMSVSPVTVGDFVGDVNQGGSCNVNHIRFTPHNLTHIEMSSHISSNGATLADRPLEHSTGIMKLVDVVEETQRVGAITKDMILPKLTREFPFNILGIKSSVSSRNTENQFSGKDPLYLDPELAKYLSREWTNIHTLVLDLPSADKENDGGLLLAHRNFMDLPKQGYDFVDSKYKAIIELANLQSVDVGYYYTTISPFRVDLDAFILDIIVKKIHL